MRQGQTVHDYLGAGKIRFLPLQPGISQKQSYIQGKIALSFGFMLKSSVPLFAYTAGLKKNLNVQKSTKNITCMTTNWKTAGNGYSLIDETHG